MTNTPAPQPPDTSPMPSPDPTPDPNPPQPPLPLPKTVHVEVRRTNNEAGLIKYGIAWMLGVPLSVLVIIFILARGC